jgi:tetratricopeptide (TPR) repeat protein
MSPSPRQHGRSGALLALLALLTLLSACPPPATTPLLSQPTVEPTAAERLLLDDAAAHREGRLASVSSALVVGGPRDPNELGARTQELERRLASIVASLPAADAATRGRALLGALFQPGSEPALLRTYEIDASTLYGVVAAGRYNCVSATMLYILGARMAGIDARPVLLPSHARALVVAGGRRYVVETTVANGFDPPAWVSKATLDRARPRGAGNHVDLYADERGTEVDWAALLGIAYGNLGILAQARGDVPLATALLAREVALTPPAQVPIVKAQQASLLTELATRALKERRLAEALALARSAFDAAPDAETKRLTDQNVAAIATQKLTADEPQLDDARLAAYAEPFRGYPAAYGDIQALVLTLVADRRLRRGDVEGSARALQQAAGMATSAEMRGQTGHNARLGELNRIAKLSTTDPEGAWAALSRLGPRDPALGTSEDEVGRVVVHNRAIFHANAGRCTELEAALASAGAAPVEHADGLRAGCHERHALAASERGDFAGAIEDMRTAVRVEPGDPVHRQNLAVMIEKEVDRLVHAGRCGDTAGLIAEGRTLAQGDTFFDEATAFCKAAR